MLRYRQSAFDIPDAEEEVLAAVIAFDRMLGWPLNIRLWGWGLAGILGLAALALSAFSRLDVNWAMEPQIAAGVILALSVTAGAIAYFLGRTVPIHALTKAYLRLCLIHLDRGGVLLVAPCSETSVEQVTTYNLDHEALLESSRQLVSRVDNLMAEKGFLGQLENIRRILSECETEKFPFPFIPCESELYQGLRAAVADGETASGEKLSLRPAFPLRSSLLQEATTSARSVEVFISTHYPAILQEVSERVKTEASRFRRALTEKATQRSTEVSRTAQPACMAEDSNRLESLRQAVSQVFKPVVQALQEEVSGPLQELEAQREEALAGIRRHYRQLMREAEASSNARLRVLRRSLSERQHQLSELDRELGKIRYEISQLEAAVTLDSTSAERWRIQQILESKHQDLKRIQAEYAHLERTIEMLHGEQAGVAWESIGRALGLMAEQYVEEKRIRRNHETRVQKLTQHIHQISQDQAQLQGFIKRAQSAVQREQVPGITMEVMPYEVELIELKLGLLDVLVSGINAEVEELLKVWEDTALLIKQHTAPEADFGGACLELRVPVWLMLCSQPPVWRLAIGPCGIKIGKARFWRHSGVRIDKGPYEVIWDYIERECQPFFEEISDELEAHSIIETDKQRSQLLAKMEGMYQRGLLSVPLLAEVRRLLEAQG